MGLRQEAEAPAWCCLVGEPQALGMQRGQVLLSCYIPGWARGWDPGRGSGAG